MARKNIGQFTKKITFYRNEQVTGELEQTVIKPMPYITVWANVVEFSGNETYDAQKLRGNAFYKFTVRYSSKVNRKTITNDMMIKYRDDFFDIKDVNDVQEAHDQLEIACELHIFKKKTGGLRSLDV